MTLFLALIAAAAAGDVPAQQPEAAVEEKKICKRVEMTGSRVGGKRECRTEAEWAAIQRAAQQTADDMRKMAPGPKSN